MPVTIAHHTRSKPISPPLNTYTHIEALRDSKIITIGHIQYFHNNGFSDTTNVPPPCIRGSRDIREGR